jgi:hypothetical protein
MPVKAQAKKKGGTRGGGLLKTVKQKAKEALTGKKEGKGKGRKRGPQYWANKVLVAKLKKKYYKIKYAGV